MAASDNFKIFRKRELAVHSPGRITSSSRRTHPVAAGLLVLLLALAVPAKASVTLLVSEPFGSFGTMMPLGHAGVYLDRVCADTPTHLRLCRPGEMGIVLSRYHRVADIDWLAIPILPFLYGVDTPAEVPHFMTLPREAEIREQYRLRYLRQIIPDGPHGGPAKKGEWVETIGVTFDRRVWAYRIETTVDQDQHLIDTLNHRPNLRAYKLRTANCANFAADMVNLLYPGLVHQDKVSDFGLMTPKQVARSMVNYNRLHPEANLTVMEIPQIPGTLRRSRPIWGVSESGLKTKRYLFTLLLIQPEVIAGCGIVYLDRGRWKIGDGAVPASPGIWLNPETQNTQVVQDTPAGHPPQSPPSIQPNTSDTESIAGGAAPIPSSPAAKPPARNSSFQ